MLKNLLFTFKQWFKTIFSYPSHNIDISYSSDYDAYWKQKRGKNIGTISDWQKERADYILNYLKSCKSELVVADVGCGDGSILRYLKMNTSNIKCCYGYDNSQFALSQAAKFGVITTQLDISDVSSYSKLKNADFYFILETLEHIVHSEVLLKHAYKVSEQGIFISFPNTGYINHRLRLLFGKFPLQWRVIPNEHVRFWTYSDLRWWLSALSFEKYEIYPYRGIPFLNKILPGIFSAGFLIFIDSK